MPPRGPIHISQLPPDLQGLDIALFSDARDVVVALGRVFGHPQQKMLAVEAPYPIGMKASTIEDHIRIEIVTGGMMTKEDIAIIFLSKDGNSYVVWDSRIDIDAFRRFVETAVKVIPTDPSAP